MGLIDTVRRWFAPTQAKTSASMRDVRAYYDAIQTTDENQKHWQWSDALSARAANSAMVRKKYRERARYESANNCYAYGMTSTLANNCIGTGPRLQIHSDLIEDARIVEEEFRSWCKRVRLTEKLRTMRRAWAVDGEAFALFVTNPKLDGVQLDIRLIEADQVANPTLYLETRNQVDGITFDEAGNPTIYKVLKDHPGDMVANLNPLLVDEVAAENVLHLFRCDRPGQVRGIPEIAPALPLYAQLRRYTLAVIAAAETAANMAGIVYSDAAPENADYAPDPMDTFEVERNMMMTMPAGWKVNQLKAEQPTTTYDMFKHEIINEIARCLNMPFNIAAGNSSNYNYSSGRLDHQVYFQSVDIDRDHIETVLLEPIFYRWLSEAVLIEDYLPQSMRSTEPMKHTWHWDGYASIDPVKDATADEIRLRSMTTTLAEVYAKRGVDVEDALAQIAREQQRMAELGIAEIPTVEDQELDPMTEEDDATN